MSNRKLDSVSGVGKVVEIEIEESRVVQSLELYAPTSAQQFPTPHSMQTLNAVVSLVSKTEIDSGFADAQEMTRLPVMYNNSSSASVGRIGFVNTGQTCYFNAVMQAQQHCAPFAQLMTSYPWATIERGNLSTDGSREFVNAFMKQIQTYWTGEQATMHPRAEQNAFIQCKPFFTPRLQHDAHEALSAILCLLDDVMSPWQRSISQYNALLRKGQPTWRPSSLQKLLFNFIDSGCYPQEAKSPVRHALEGRTTTSIVCSKCKGVSKRDENWLNLQLPQLLDAEAAALRKHKGESQGGLWSMLWKSEDPLSTELCLEALFQDVSLDGPNAYSCEPCKMKVPAISSTRISSLPPVQAIQVQRFQLDGSKNSKGLTYPLTLDLKHFVGSSAYSGDGVKEQTPLPQVKVLDPFVAVNAKAVDTHLECGFSVANPIWANTVQKQHEEFYAQAESEGYSSIGKQPVEIAMQTQYTLCAVVRHLGSAVDGHYVSYARCGSQWYLFDDSKVTPIATADVLKVEAYLLFYCANTPDKKEEQVLVDKCKAFQSVPFPLKACLSNVYAPGIATSQQLRILSYEHQVALRAPKTQCMLISGAWVMRLAATKQQHPVDNRDLFCYHSRPLQVLPYRAKAPSRLVHTLQITKEAYRLLIKVYGGGPHFPLVDAFRFARAALTVADIADNASFEPFLDHWSLNTQDIMNLLQIEVSPKLSSMNGSAAHGECLECCDEDNRRVQKERVNTLEMESRNGDAQFAMVNVAWVKCWRGYITDKGPRPDPIDNMVLLEANGTPKEGLQYRQHYYAIHPLSFNYLLSVYGGGPVIIRKTTDIYDVQPIPPEFDSRTGLPKEPTTTIAE